MLLRLPQRRSGNRFDTHEPPRHFERRQLFAADGFERGGVEVADDVCHRYFAAHRVGHPADGGFAHTGLFEQELFDLARVDIETAGDDEVTLVAAQCVVAVGGAGGQIAGVEPSLAPRGGGGIGAAPVAGTDRGAFDERDVAWVCRKASPDDVTLIRSSAAMLLACCVVISSPGSRAFAEMAAVCVVAWLPMPPPRKQRRSTTGSATN